MTIIFKHISSILFCLAMVTQGWSQVNVRDSIVSGTLIHFSLGLHTPGGDLAERYGGFMSVGLGVEYKFRSNWLFGVMSDFYFGDLVKNRDVIFEELLTAQGGLIGTNGEYAVVDFLHRGVYVGPHVAKILPLFGPNRNSGLLIRLSGGYLQNQIYFRNPNETFPQLLGEYGKGYDRMHTGFAMKQFIAFMHSGNRRTINFTLGLEFIQGFTRNERAFNFDTRQPDTDRKLDLYFGFKAGWFLPIYSDQRERFYYF